MASTKISQLASLASPASNDLLVVVDVSDTSMAPSGTDKKALVSSIQTDLSAPAPIGDDTPNTVTATDLTATGTVQLNSAGGFDGAGIPLLRTPQTVFEILGSFTPDSEYQIIDLSTWVPAGAIAVDLEFDWYTDAAYTALELRVRSTGNGIGGTFGDFGDGSTIFLAGSPAGTYQPNLITLRVGSDRRVEYMRVNPPVSKTTFLRVVLHGWHGGISMPVIGSAGIIVAQRGENQNYPSFPHGWVNSVTGTRILGFRDWDGTNLAAHSTGGAAWIIRNEGDLGTFTAVAATDVITTSSAHGLAVGDILQFSSTNTLPAGLSEQTYYYVITVPSVTTITVSESFGGSVVDITSTGTGTHRVTQLRLLFAAGAVNGAVAIPDGQQIQDVFSLENPTTHVPVLNMRTYVAAAGFFYSVSSDDGLTWEVPLECPEFSGLPVGWISDESAFFDFIWNADSTKIYGTLYLTEAAQTSDHQSVALMETTDGFTWSFKSWICRYTTQTIGMNETGIIRMPGGRLMAAGRSSLTNGSFGYTTYSDDDGATWTTPVIQTGCAWEAPRLISMGNKAAVFARNYDAGTFFPYSVTMISSTGSKLTDPIPFFQNSHPSHGGYGCFMDEPTGRYVWHYEDLKQRNGTVGPYLVKSAVALRYGF